MRFVSIPQNGASWSDKLIYSFDTELDEPTDVDVEIYNQTTHQLIARKRLYGVTQAEVDIAPILRSAIEMRVDNVESTMVQSSLMGCRVAVGIMDLMSVERLFCAANIDLLRPQMMSCVPDKLVMGYGESLFFSVVAPDGLQVKIVEYTPTSKRSITLTPEPDLVLYDVVICTSSLRGNVERIEVSVNSDSELLASFECRVELQPPAGHRLVWRNRQGGLESYLFPKSLPLVSEVDIDTFSTSAGLMSKIRGSRERYRLCSALECGKVLQSLREIIYAPYIYEMMLDKLSDVVLATRRMEYGKHGELQSVALEVVGDLRGGEL